MAQLGQQAINTKPPIGDADGVAENQFSLVGIIKLIAINQVQTKIASLNFSFPFKFFLYVMIFSAQFYYNARIFLNDRAPTLFDHFQVARNASFADLKNAKNNYLSVLQNKEDPLYDGDKSHFNFYNLTQSEIMDAYHLLTSPILREQYDKHNIYFTQDDFAFKKGKSIQTMEKWSWTIKGCAGYLPFCLVIWLAFGNHAHKGKQMAIIGLIVSAFITFEMKRPAEVTSENWVVVYINEYYSHPYILKMIGEKSKFFTVYQLSNFFKSLIWQTYFQFSIALSRLIDSDPDQEIELLVIKTSNKLIKSLQIFEYIKPQRCQNILAGEITPDIKKVLDEQEGKKNQQILKIETPNPEQQDDSLNAAETQQNDNPENTEMFQLQPKEDFSQYQFQKRELEIFENERTQSQEFLSNKQKELVQYEEDLLKFEKYLKWKESEILKSESDFQIKLSSKIQESKWKTLDELVKEEMERCLLQWSKAPVFKQIMELEKLSWGTKIKNTYAIALEIRKISIVKRLRKQREDWDLKQKGKYLRRNCNSLFSCVGYTCLFFFILSVVLPPLLLNYFKTQVETGEWVDVSEFMNVNETLKVDIVENVQENDEEWEIMQQSIKDEKLRKFQENEQKMKDQQKENQDDGNDEDDQDDDEDDKVNEVEE